MAKLTNLKVLMSNSRTRVIFIVTLAVIIVALVIAVSFFNRGAQTSSSNVGGVPQINAVVGGFDHAPTPQYAKLQREQNAAQATQALQTGGTAIPTIIESQNLGAAPPLSAAPPACTPTVAAAANAGPQALGTVCSDGTVRNAQGQIVGHTGTVVPGGFIYDKNGKVIGTVGPDGKVRDANGKILGEIGADGLVRDANGNVIGSAATPIDKASQAGTLVYGKNGQVIGVVGADGLVRDANGNVIGTVGPDGVVRDANGNVIGTEAAASKVGALVYDKNGKLLGTIGADGLVRDANGKVIGTVGADGMVRGLDGKIIGSTSLSGPRVGSKVYDKNGKLLGTVGADGKVRDANGNIVGVVGPDGVVRDASGNIIGAVGTAPKAGTLVYDKNGKVIGTVGADGLVRDANGNVIGTVGPDGTVRDANGNVIGCANALPKAGTLVYDKNGRVIGTVGADGKVRDANGNVVGSVGPDGVVRDINGNIIGQASTPVPGTPVYDSNGKLIGYVGADGVVRDVSGKVIGTVGADGMVRDANGNIIGKASYIAPGSPVFGPDGKLMGTIGPDGRLIPVSGTVNAGSVTNNQPLDPKQAAAAQQARILGIQKQQQLQSLMQGAMNGQMSQLLAAWTPPTQQYTQGIIVDPNHKGGFSAGGERGATDGSGGPDGASAVKTLIKAGTVTFAVLNTAINSDEPGPILATITEGKLKGGKIMGTLQLQKEKVMLSFNSINIPGVEDTVKLNVIAVDPNTARTAVASNVDNHYMMRYGALFASSFLQSYSQAVTQAGSSTTYTTDGVVHTYPSLNSQQKMIVALGGVGSAYSNVIAQAVNAPPTVTVDAGTSLGILFLSDMATPPGMDDA